MCWNRETELLGRFQIAHQLEFRWLLHRQVVRLALSTIMSIYLDTRRVTVCEAG